MPDSLKHGPFEARFWRGVTPSNTESCWEWQRYCCPSTGYGRIADRSGYKKIGAHRASWLIHNGDIPEGMFVCHTCDNRKCVNPSHLFLGTAADNCRDMWEKGRGSKPPLSPPGRSASERQEANRIRMGRTRTHCKRGHALPPYESGRRRLCYEPECRGARRFNALGR
ncbi:HNH endonuclease signature motif containing protein [Mycobacteroides abscessus]|uniref:HNH endonuclease signature motif containing protein n=1 Tax=Mycobacteroides abscessus TaxID=36809 RepID=UPI001A975DA7